MDIDKITNKVAMAALNATNEGILISDATQKEMPLIYVNKAFEELTGYSADEILGQNCRFLQKKDRHQENLPEIRQALKSGTACRHVIRNYGKDGSLFWNELSLAPILDENGQLEFFVGVQKDVTSDVRYRDTIVKLAGQGKYAS